MSHGGSSEAPAEGRRGWRIAAGIYAAATLLALAGWAWRDAAVMQPVNLTTFWWSLPAAPLVAVAWWRGGRLAGALVAVPAVLWLWAYGTAFLPAVGTGPAGATADLRVVSFNTYVAASGIDHVRALVARERPDVLLLQEVFPPRVAALREALGERYPHSEVVPSPGVGGVAVLSRRPIADVRPVGDATRRSRSTAVVVLEAGGRRVQVVPVHLLSPCPGCGPSLVERAQLEEAVRRAEIGTVLGALDPDLPAVVGGDFNSTERSTPYRRLVQAGFRDPQREVGSGMGFTWPNHRGPAAVVRIDWVLTRGLRPVAARVGRGGASDHRPVIVDLAWVDGDRARGTG